MSAASDRPEARDADVQADDQADHPADDDIVLTIDLGTSGPKVAAFTVHGAFLDGEFEPVPLLLTEDGGAEQDPAAWWDGIRACVARLRGRGGMPDRLAAISVTSQWSGTVAVDERGDPLANAITWMDSRGAEAIKRYVGGPLRVQGYDPRKLRKWIQISGGAPSLSGKDPAAHIHWLRGERPGLSSRTWKYLEPKDWLNLKLTGECRATHDSIVLHWVTDNRDPGRVRYDDTLLGLAGLVRDWLPDLVPATSVIGEVGPIAAEQLGLPAGTPVVGGTPDVQSAIIGSGAVADFEGHLYLGTSSWLTCHVPFKKTDVLRGVASLPSPVPGRYFVADEQEVAGGALDWLSRQLSFPDDDRGDQSRDVFGRIDEVALSSPPGAGGVIFTPWLNGERTPVDDHTIRAGWHNVSLRTDRADLVRAVLEGVAHNSRWLLDSVEKFCGRPFEWINVVGGGGRSAAWAQIHADVLDRPIRRVENPIRANARGAALLAGLALGRLEVGELGEKVTVVETHEPDATNRARYDEAYAAFRSIYSKNKGIHRRLNGRRPSRMSRRGGR